MAESPQKEMMDFFTECIGMGGVLLLIVGVFILKILETLGVIKITLWQ